MTDYVSVSIPRELAERIKKHIDGTEFKDISEYITFVLNEVLESYEQEEKTFTKEEEEKIKERLRALGYLE